MAAPKASTQEPSGSMRYQEPNVIEKEFLQAAKSGNMGTLKILADQVNNPRHVRDSDGLSPFHYAAEGNQVEVMEYLVACGCDPMAKDGRGGTCVLEAANAGSWALASGSEAAAALTETQGVKRAQLGKQGMSAARRNRARRGA